ncbi:MAG TPA: nucleotidyltransferase family protein [Bacteroidia bacterium]|nr:nucleotidyltransferase family protein [Bacteroidia bacterium]
MLKEAIILAGGFGTRLKEVVADVPKPMAPVCNKPFLDYLLKYLAHYGIEKITLSVGHMAEKIISHYGDKYTYSVEKDPLGTGGGIRLAMEKCQSKNVLVLNGDSFFDINLNSFYNSHCTFHSDCSLALREVPNAARYGTIKPGSMNAIKAFREKTGIEREGIINAGVYLLNREIFLQKTPPEKNFSIEKDFFETRLNELNIFGFIHNGYFIDIGIPEDFTKAQHDFKEFKY